MTPTPIRFADHSRNCADVGPRTLAAIGRTDHVASIAALMSEAVEGRVFDPMNRLNRSIEQAAYWAEQHLRLDIHMMQAKLGLLPVYDELADRAVTARRQWREAARYWYSPFEPMDADNVLSKSVQP